MADGFFPYGQRIFRCPYGNATRPILFVGAPEISEQEVTGLIGDLCPPTVRNSNKTEIGTMPRPSPGYAAAPTTNTLVGGLILLCRQSPGFALALRPLRHSSQENAG